MSINKRTISTCIILSLVTFGIYFIYWEYLLIKNIKLLKKDTSSCTSEMLCLIFVPFYSLYWWYTRGKYVRDELSKQGHSVSSNEVIYLILGIFGLQIVSMAIMQNDFNSISTEALESNHAKVYSSRLSTKKLTTIGMLCAIAFVIVAFVRIPVVLFLKYEPKDVIITVGGFMMGPMASLIISTVVALLEMVTISDTGVIGAVMNLISSCAFCCTASFIYKKKHTMQGAVIGLVGGAVIMTGVMLLWNYLITPIYMGYPREAVAAMLVPVFLPFNLLKGFLNAGISLLIYKPVVGALRKAHLIEGSTSASGAARKFSPGMIAIAVFLVATGVVMALALSGVI